MSCWDYYSRTIRTVAWSAAVADDPRLHAALDRLDRHGVVVKRLQIDREEDLPPDLRNGQTLWVRPAPARQFGRCPGTHGHFCCNYLTLNAYVGCTLECSYCIMQSYLRSRAVHVYLDLVSWAAPALHAATAANPDRIIRVGTGEVGDSLLFDPLFELSSELIAATLKLPRVRLELKSKTDYVDHLPIVSDPRRPIVLGFSLNPASVVATEEGYAATLDRRLAAAQRAVERGYDIAFHFDPIIRVPEWEVQYRALVEQLRGFDPARVAWISLGTLRYPPQLRAHLEDRPYMLDEFLVSNDGKLRYIQRVRAQLYRTMRSALGEVLPDAPVYLCMESRAVWHNMLGSNPSAAVGLRPILQPVQLPWKE